MQRQVMVTNITSLYTPFYQQIRALVDLPDGGLANPMPLLFDSHLGQKADSAMPPPKFKYPQLTNVTRPSSDVDLAYMTVGFKLNLIWASYESRSARQMCTSRCFT